MRQVSIVYRGDEVRRTAAEDTIFENGGMDNEVPGISLVDEATDVLLAAERLSGSGVGWISPESNIVSSNVIEFVADKCTCSVRR